MSTIERPAALAALVVFVAACAGWAASATPSTSSPSSSPSTSRSSAPTSTPGSPGVIEHATGSTDVLLRYEEGGGFIMPAWTAAQAPAFTLYGDGTIILRNTTQGPIPAIGSVVPFHPFRTARMNEEQIQKLLEYALGEGGLGVARAEYPSSRIADAATAVFTVNAGGLAKTVSVYALGYEAAEVPDLSPARHS
jgi:hypothetical protein